MVACLVDLILGRLIFCSKEDEQLLCVPCEVGGKVGVNAAGHIRLWQGRPEHV